MEYFIKIFDYFEISFRGIGVSNFQSINDTIDHTEY